MEDKNERSIDEIVEEMENSLAALTREAEKKNNKRSTCFCPLIRDMCRVDCVCYSKATVNNVQGVEPYVTGGYCSAFILTGST